MENPDPSEVGQAPPKIDRPCAHCGRRNAEKLCQCTTIATELCDNCVVPHIDANQHLTHLTAKLVIAAPLEDDLELDDVTPEEHVKLINTNRLNHRCDEIKAEL
ncbi:MAG: hypothetical protein V2I33_22990 [Kangiellaceae bacterium]|jgi:hypothetical protein|nr:hypothetical protein [Kangiellaceae bacterium]